MNHPYPNVDEIWRDYTLGELPRDFINRFAGDTAEDCVDAFLDTLPRVYGIIRRDTWSNSFEQDYQLRPDEVRHAMLAYLEQHQGEWEVLPHAERPRPHHIQDMSHPDPVPVDVEPDQHGELPSEEPRHEHDLDALHELAEEEIAEDHEDHEAH